MTDDDRIEVLANGGGTQLAPDAPDPFDEDDPGPWPIHGVAMTPGLATGGSLIPTVWTADVLEDATPKLAGKDIVTDRKHDPEESPGAREVIGEVTVTEYLSGHGIGYNGEVDDREIAQKIARGRLDASPYLYRTLTDETRVVDGTEASVAEEVLGFDNLAVVRNGAGGDDVAIQAGPHPDLGSEAAEALAEAFPADAQPSDGPAEPGTGLLTIDTNMSNNDPDDPDPTVESLSEEVETLRRENKRLRAENSPIKGTLAETLAADSPFTADELADRFSFDELRERVEDDDVVETLTPDPRTRDPDPAGATPGSGGAETLSADEEQELDTLQQRREALSEHATDEHLDELDDRIETLADRRDGRNEQQQ
jgi:cell division protein FtsB